MHSPSSLMQQKHIIDDFIPFSTLLKWTPQYYYIIYFLIILYN